MQATSTGRALAWALLILLAIANVAGYALDLYQRFWWFDRVLHAATIFAITLWLALFVCAQAFRDGHAVLVVLLVASVGLAIGAIWEVAEWGFDQIAPGNVIKGKYDTIIDLVMDTIGAVSAGMLSLAFLGPLESRDSLEYQKLVSGPASIIEMLAMPGAEDVEFEPPQASKLFRPADLP